MPGVSDYIVVFVLRVVDTIRLLNIKFYMIKSRVKKKQKKYSENASNKIFVSKLVPMNIYLGFYAVSFWLFYF